MEALVFETALGHTALARQDEQVMALSFGHRSKQAAIKALSRVVEIEVPVEYFRPGKDEMVDQICAYAAGEEVSYDDLETDASGLTQFGRKVTAACRNIPWGKTRTYGQLAAEAGRPGAARAVGSVMARNRVPLIVPCHRVVPAAGGLGGFSAPQGVSMKRRLLKMEQQTASLAAH